MENNEKHSPLAKFMMVLLVVGVFILFVAIGNSDNKEAERLCMKTGCGSERVAGSYYCYVHKPYYSTKSSYSSSSGSSSSTSTSTSGSSTSSSTKKSYSGSPSKKSSSSGSSWKSYDEGYDAVYEDDDYDWDRYWSDSDYADGVDDAMDELDW